MQLAILLIVIGISTAEATPASAAALPPRRVAEAVVFFDYAGVGAMRTTLLFASKSLATGGGAPMLLSVFESAFGLGQVIGALLIGRLSDQFGRRALLNLCLCCSALAYALAGSALTASSTALLLLSRIPAGISKQTTTTCRAIVCDSTAPAERSSALSTLYACSALGYAFGPLLGGALTERGGQHIFAYLTAAGFAALAPSSFALLGETLPVAASTSARPKAGVWHRPAVMRALLSCCLPEVAAPCDP